MSTSRRTAVNSSRRAREARLRRLASQQGLAVLKSRSRTSTAPDFERYCLVDRATDSVVAGVAPFGYSLSLDDVEEYLSADRS